MFKDVRENLSLNYSGCIYFRSPFHRKTDISSPFCGAAVVVKTGETGESESSSVNALEP